MFQTRPSHTTPLPILSHIDHLLETLLNNTNTVLPCLSTLGALEQVLSLGRRGTLLSRVDFLQRELCLHGYLRGASLL